MGDRTETGGTKCAGIRFSQHAIKRMFERDIEQADVAETLRAGVLVEDYPKDLPFPSCLLLGHSGALPLHVVIGLDPESGLCVVITVYVPGPDYWKAGWTRRKRP